VLFVSSLCFSLQARMHFRLRANAAAKALVETLAEKPNRVIFSGKPTKLTPESEILKSSKPVPAIKP
jgi:hypothetical protein